MHQNLQNKESQETDKIMTVQNVSEGETVGQQIEKEPPEVPDPLDDTMDGPDTVSEDHAMDNIPEQMNQDSSFLSGSTNESLNITANNSSTLDSSLFQEKDL